MNSDYSSNFILRILKIKGNLNYDLIILDNNLVEFFISSSIKDELTEPIMLADAIRIISIAKMLGAKLIEDVEDYCDDFVETIENEIENEEFDEEVEFDDEYEEYDNEEDDRTIYLDGEELDILEREIFNDMVENEITVSFVLQFEDKEAVQKFLFSKTLDKNIF